ncbi:MAG TPA: hypothetical protein P5123_04315 [Spirochaetota bacterium]|nr:hypothetical protein [Spirochaetota bacterium]
MSRELRERADIISRELRELLTPITQEIRVRKAESFEKSSITYPGFSKGDR